MTLSRPVVLVTGGGAGIGRACARKLAADGQHVIVIDQHAGRVSDAAEEIQAEGGSCEGHVCDVSDSRQIDAVIASIVDRHSRLDGAVNNAGISGARVPLAELDDEFWAQTRAVNLDGVLYCMRAEIRAMIELGGGSIVTMASILSTVAYPDAAAYIATKHGVLGLTRSAALDYAAQGIRVNAIGPGFIDGERRAGMSEDARRELTDLHPIGRLGTPEDVAELVAFLLSPASRNITGSFFPTDGGFTVR
jgi:NAD(P)-dependent dehydrogenase (short-subunit alcohol dehydrogenase family)